MRPCRYDGQQTPPTSPFSFWPRYDEGVGWMEEEESGLANGRAKGTANATICNGRARSSKEIAIKASVWSKKAIKIHGADLKQCDVGRKSIHPCVKSSKALGFAQTTVPTALSRRSTSKRVPEFASRTPWLERPRSSKVPVSSLRINPATVGAPKCTSKKPSPFLLPDPPPQPQPQPRSRLQPQSCAHAQARTIANIISMRSPRHLRPCSSTTNHTKCCASTPIITLHSHKQKCASHTAASCSSNANPQSSQPRNAFVRRIRHVLDFVHFPFGWKFKKLRDKHGGIFSPPLQSTKLPLEKVAFMHTKMPLTRPLITIQSCDGRCFKIVHRAKRYAMCSNNTNDETKSTSYEEVLYLMPRGGNVFDDSLETVDFIANYGGVRLHLRQVGHACEIVLRSSSLHSLTSLQSPQRAALRCHEKKNCRPIDSTPRILLHDSVVKHTPAAQTMSKIMPITMYNLLSPSAEQEFEMPPVRIATPASPFLSDDNVYCKALGNRCLLDLAYFLQC
ncbi:conserved hypothetical protein [Echinococcus multilocularis]|uniref:Uncharacterized protein n=1 Tax=Echinococcus multilocularis TaxID=6211 RepID=A0A068YF83_ECHMU|nr:conserved hypothetical protein [Echinococcus multilocularis]